MIGLDMVGNPFCRGARPGLDGGSDHTRKAGLSTVLVGDLLSRGPPTACGIGILVGLFVSLPAILQWAGTQRVVTSLSLVMILEWTSEIAVAKRCPGPRASDLSLSMAAVESEKMVY